ncbi:bifunctional DNA primase/polymerase [Roseomonas sp. NAR14]|uniref:Bifunctional DNA primase/polymerase n=1 Tax=Roseomonas acroporae TaxID=2937791 RepID=A0A9X2BWX3_9PROT|nr:bifunctional DNA primase/polymerase [Roseomonas acroporae]
MSLHPDLERLALIGWRLVPQTPKTRKGYWRGYRDDATHDLDTLERWQREYPHANWCVETGPASRMWVLDVDVPSAGHAADGIAALRRLIEQHGPLPDRPTGRSGSGGYALVFRWTDDAPTRSRTGWPVAGLDVRSHRVVQTIAPSIHRHTGKPYKWAIAPWEMAAPPAPKWLLEACAPPPEPKLPPRPMLPTTDKAMRRLDRACVEVVGAVSGTRNATLNKQAFAVGRWLGAGLLGEHEAVGALYAAARHAGLEDLEARDTIRSGLTAGAARPVEARFA